MAVARGPRAQADADAGEIRGAAQDAGLRQHTHQLASRLPPCPFRRPWARGAPGNLPASEPASWPYLRLPSRARPGRCTPRGAAARCHKRCHRDPPRAAMPVRYSVRRALTTRLPGGRARHAGTCSPWDAPPALGPEGWREVKSLRGGGSVSAMGDCQRRSH